MNARFRKYDIVLFLVTFFVLAFMVVFNNSIKKVRINELKLFLQKENRADNQVDHLGLVVRYINNMKSYNKKLHQDRADVVEMRVKSLLSTGKKINEISLHDNNPLEFIALKSINMFRFITGKSPIKNYYNNKSNIYIEAGYYYERNSLYKKSINMYKLAREEERVDRLQEASVLLHEGFCYSLTGEYDKAKDKYRNIINDYSNERIAVTASLLLRYLEGFMSEIERVLKNDRDSLNKAVKLYHLIAYKEALNVIDKVDKRTSGQDRPRLLYIKGRCYEELADRNKAIKLYQSIIQKFKNSNYAKFANRRIFISGSMAIDGNALKQIAVENNQMLKDAILIEFIKEEKRNREDGLNYKVKSLFDVLKNGPVFSDADIMVHNKILDSINNKTGYTIQDVVEVSNNEKQKEVVATAKDKIKESVKVIQKQKIKVYTNDGNVFIGVPIDDQPSYITLKTIIGPVTIEKNKIMKRENM